MSEFSNSDYVLGCDPLREMDKRQVCEQLKFLASEGAENPASRYVAATVRTTLCGVVNAQEMNPGKAEALRATVQAILGDTGDPVLATRLGSLIAGDPAPGAPAPKDKSTRGV